MRILILANNAGGLYGFRGELLQALVLRGFEVFFGVPQPSEDGAVKMMEAIGCQYLHTPMSRRGMNPLAEFRLISGYKRVAQTVTPNLILSYTIKPNVYGNYVGNRLGIPVITNVTGMGTSLSSGHLKCLVKRMYRYACDKAAVVFFQNQGNLNFFLENNMVSPNKIRLIPGSGVNLDKFRPMQKTNKDDGITRFLFIGRIMGDKGILEYLEAANRITEQTPNIEFQIVGSYEEEEYRELIENNPRVKYLGRSSDVREQIREVDCIVHPSYHEGMSNALLEGAAMGKPLIASNISGCKEIVDDGLNGYLFNPKSVDSMVKKLKLFLALNDEQRMEMGLISRQKVENEFDRNLVVEAYLQAISEIIDRK